MTRCGSWERRREERCLLALNGVPGRRWCLYQWWRICRRSWLRRENHELPFGLAVLVLQSVYRHLTVHWEGGWWVRGRRRVWVTTQAEGSSFLSLLGSPPPPPIASDDNNACYVVNTQNTFGKENHLKEDLSGKVLGQRRKLEWRKRGDSASDGKHQIWVTRSSNFPEIKCSKTWWEL